MNTIIIKRPNQELLSCNFVIPVGERTLYQNQRLSFAHLIEHLLFHAHPRLSQYELMIKLETLGVIINAATSDYATEVFLRVRKVNLFKALELIIEAINSFSINEETYEKEKAIINLEEKLFREQRLEVFLKNSFRDFYGLTESDEIADYQKVCEVYHELYQSKNWSLIIIGAIDKDLEKLIINKFGTGKVKQSPEKIYYEKYSEKIYFNEGEDNLQFCYFRSCHNTTSYLEMKLIKNLFVSGLASFLYNYLVTCKKSCYSLLFYDIISKGSKSFAIYSQSTNDYQNIINQIFIKVFQDKTFLANLSDEDYERVKEMTLTELTLKSEITSSVASDIVYSYIYCGEILSYDDLIIRLQGLTITEVRSRIIHAIFNEGDNYDSSKSSRKSLHQTY